MSHPVSLNSAPELRMPNGSAHEWSSFFDDDKPSLEANAFFPLLWLALFRVEDIQWARLIDAGDWDESRDSSSMENPPDTTTRYPYLVTTKENGLALFTQRKAPLQSAVGPAYAAVIDAFELLIQNRYGPNLLVCTAGMPDPEDLEPSLRTELLELDAYCTGMASHDNVVSQTLDKLQRSPGQQSLYLLSGEGTSEGWPPAEIAGAMEKIPGAPRPSTAKQPYTSRGSRMSEWAASLFLGLSTVAVYLKTHSVWLAALCFLTVTAGVVVWAVRSSKR